MSDKELDKLFQDAVAGFNTPEDASAWADMAARLDREMRPTSFWNWKSISILVFLGLTGVSVVYYALVADSEAIVQHSVSTEVTSKEKIESEKTSSSIKATADSEKDNSESQLPVNTSAVVRNIKRQNESQSGIIKSDFSQPPRNDYSASIKTGNQINSDDDRVVIVDSGQSVTELNNSAYSASRAEILVDPISKDKNAETKLPVIDSLESKSKELSEKSKTIPNFFSLKLSVSPDFSSIKFFDPDKPGMNYGILVGYSFSKRWSVFTGVIASRKIYSSTEIDEPYTSSGGYDYPVSKLDGDCRVLDIPLNVYYSFYQGRTLSFSAGLGVSSYLMLEEDYIYHVDNPYGSNVYSNSVENKNNEWLKVLNISFIMQKKLSNQFSLEVEPFLKAPLAGVGEGKVLLVSMGASVNLRYDFLRFKQ